MKIVSCTFFYRSIFVSVLCMEEALEFFFLFIINECFICSTYMFIVWVFFYRNFYCNLIKCPLHCGYIEVVLSVLKISPSQLSFTYTIQTSSAILYSNFVSWYLRPYGKRNELVIATRSYEMRELSNTPESSTFESSYWSSNKFKKILFSHSQYFYWFVQA